MISCAVWAIIALMSAIVTRPLDAVGFGVVVMLEDAFGVADTSGSCSSSVLRSSAGSDPRVRFDLTRSDMLFCCNVLPFLIP